MRLVIMTAMQKEYDLLLRSFEGNMSYKGGNVSYYHKDKDLEVIIMKSGIGKVNAAELAILSIYELHPDHIISTGCAGSADETIDVGTIIVGNSYCYHDVWCGEPNAFGQIQGLPAVFPSGFGKLNIPVEDDVKVGAIASGDWFVTEREKMQSIKESLPECYNILAVDMESAAIAHVCYQNKVPFTSIRVISDNPMIPGQKEQYDGFWNDMALRSFDYINKIIKGL